MTLAQRGGFLEGFNRGFDASRAARERTEDRQFRRELATKSFDLQEKRLEESQKFREEGRDISQERFGKEFELKKEQIQVGRETNRLTKLNTAKTDLAKMQAGLNSVNDNVDKAESAVQTAETRVQASRNSASSLKALSAAQANLQTAITDQGSLRNAFDTAQSKVDVLSQPIRPPEVTRPTGPVSPPTVGLPSVLPTLPETQAEAEDVAVVETVEEPAEVIAESALDLSDVARGGQSIQDRLADEVAPVAEALPPDAQLPEGQKSEDRVAAQAVGVTPKDNLKFRLSEDKVSTAGAVTRGPHLQSSERIPPETEFNDVNAAIKTQIGKSIVGSINAKGLDERDHAEKILSGDISGDDVDEIGSTSNIEKTADGIGKWLESSEAQGLMKTAQGRKNIRTFIETMAVDLSRRVSEGKGAGILPELNPNDRIARENLGKLAARLFVLRDQLDRLDIDINNSVGEAGAIVIDAEIIVPEFGAEDLNLEKQFFGPEPKGKPKPPKKVKPPRRRGRRKTQR